MTRPTLLFNRYKITAPLGEGAQSTVYLVEDQLNQNVQKAAKVLKANYLEEHSDKSLIQEFQLLESIDHENLVKVFDCQFLENDQAPVVITEFIDNAKNLEDYLAEDNPLNFQDRLSITYQIISAIRYLHRKKIIHGDLKPNNILLAVDRKNTENPVTAKLIDFGVSLDLFTTQKKKRVGTPYYIAPEAVAEGIIPASDIYSLGVILYRLFINPKLPYHGMNANDILRNHLAGKSFFQDKHFQKLSLPKTLTQFIQACVQAEPLDRPNRKLNEFLRNLRFEFPELLTQMPPSTGDTRLRHFLGMRSTLYVAQKLITEHCQTPESNDLPFQHPSRQVLFVCAPTGGGKSRYLAETTKYCQRQHLEYFQAQYQQIDFWDHFIKNLMRKYPHTKTTKRMRGRVAQMLKTNDPLPKQHLYGRYLNNLAQELGGLILLIDGLGQQLPLSFIETLKTATNLTKRIQDHETSKKAKTNNLVFICTVTNRHQEATKKETEDLQIAQLVGDLHQTFVGRKHPGQGRDNPEKQLAQSQWQKIPSQIRALGQEGQAHLLLLPPWKNRDVGQYLREVFTEIEFDDAFTERLTKITSGNPGLLQSICSETLTTLTQETQKISPRILQGVLMELVRGAHVYDLGVYKLKYYDEKAKALLALIAALGRITKTSIQNLWDKVIPTEGRETVLKILIRAFDDGLIQIEGSRNNYYTLINQNLQSYLQGLARDPSHSVAFMLNKVLNLKEDLLSLDESLNLSHFIGNRKLWAKTFLEKYEEARGPAEKIKLSDSLEELRQDLSTYLNFDEVDWNAHLKIEFHAIEIFNLKRKLSEAESTANKLIDTIKNRNDAFANSLRAKTQLMLGSILRQRNQYPKAIEVLEDAINSELLNDSDHYYAIGNLVFCNLNINYREPRSNDASVNIDLLNHARKILRFKDIVRYAILSDSLGGYYMTKDQFDKALPYLELGARIYSEKNEVTRQIHTQMRIAKCLYLLTRYPEALNVLNRTLPLAEKLQLTHQSIEILVYILRTLYMMGDFRKFAPACVHLTTLCQRINDMRPLSVILEQATHAYLENGKVDKALQLVATQKQTLSQTTDPMKNLQSTICELLLVRIFQSMGKWQEAQKHNESAFKEIHQITGKYSQADAAKQAHLFYKIEALNHTKGPAQAFDEIDKFINQKAFSGFTALDAAYKSFQLAVWAENQKGVEKYLPQCLQSLKKIATHDRLNFYTNLGKHYLDQNDLENAKRALRKAAGLLNLVTNHIARAQLFDQQARLAARQGKAEKAFRFWNHADSEFKQNLKTWNEDDREHYKANTQEWQEHRIIYMLLQSGAAV